MQKIYTLFFFIILIFFSGCEANHADPVVTPTVPTTRITSDANITINENDLSKTNDTTPAFSGEYSNINKEIGISLSIGGATYKIYPSDEKKWTLDTEVPNVGTIGEVTLSKITSGTLNLLTDGTYEIKIEAEDLNGIIYKVSKQIIIDTTTDAIVEVVNIERRANNKPKIIGTSKNVYEKITITLDSAYYEVIPNDDGTWVLDTNIQAPMTGSLNLIDGNIYHILIDATDIDDNSIEQISIDFNPGLLNIVSAVYANLNTTPTNDDALFIYFNKYIDTSSTQGSPNLYINITGTGVIGTDSSGYAWHNIFDTYRILLDSNSVEFDTTSTQVSLTPGGVADSSGNEAVLNNALVNVEKFNMLARLSTGNEIYLSEDNTSVSVDSNDTKALKSDAFYGGLERNVINENGIIYYTNTGLSWEKEDSNTTQTYTEAKSYCENLALGGLNWKLPNMHELTSIVYYNTMNPSISSVYTNTKSDIYWSNEIYANNINTHWGINFLTGRNASSLDTNKNYTRCVSVRD